MNNEESARLHAQTHEALEKLESMDMSDTFRFNCHRGVECWNSCCSNTNLYLTPYDIARLRKKSAEGSAAFMDKYTTHFIGEDFGLPVVMMKMNEKGQCPFLTGEGCGVYEDRPTTCRSYPIGQAASSGSEKEKGKRLFFQVREEHCLGWNEPEERTLEQWFDQQELFEYNINNEFPVFLSFHPKLGKDGALDDKKQGMIFMALYDLDKFREFVFNTSFLERFDVPAETVEKIKSDEIELLGFGMKWVEYSILGSPVFDVKSKE